MLLLSRRMPLDRNSDTLRKRWNCFFCSLSSAQDPADGAYDGSPDLLVGWGAGYPITPHTIPKS